MSWIKSLLTPKSAIFAAGIALAGLLAVQSYRLSLLRTDYAQLETSLEKTKGSLAGALSANDSNLITIEAYKKANKALLEHNAQNTKQSKAAAAKHQANLEEIKKRYEQAKQVPIAGRCANFTISDDVDKLLKQQARSGH
ncbi:MAG: hypothetical protein DWP95_10470 [Proteobacteria bacterium]|nr:MAG: hypothetical protein DWP95_10470 [Pseudomonadota bacterium]